ncbi:DUF1211 domain-containing protein [Shimazuella sp. AN120528]|uniref:TMEM175 family protein n=1 Tax=Shimazuella soli TaxID=1892854 RepID=UPI001F0E6721|nr:DUF1211 domain-containing protein [Shimazuella soli]MCH5586128.1 DUF1211 domain-containing protein [Shimazuella soli]
MEKEHGIFRSERMLAYCDAIFAIALTLLIIEIRLPEHVQGESLWTILLHQWPKFLSFLISFMIISVVWFNHHTMFHYIKKVDHRLIIMNTLLMLNVVVIPFCSSLLGEYITSGNPNAKISALIYGAWISIGGVPFNMIWTYALKKKELLEEGYSHTELMYMKKHFNRGPIIYLVVTLLALINVWISVIGFVLLIALYFLPATKWTKRKS